MSSNWFLVRMRQIRPLLYDMCDCSLMSWFKKKKVTFGLSGKTKLTLNFIYEQLRAVRAQSSIVLMNRATSILCPSF